MTTAEPTLVLKKVMVASQPLPEETQLMRLRLHKRDHLRGILGVDLLTTLPSQECQPSG